MWFRRRRHFEFFFIVKIFKSGGSKSDIFIGTFQPLFHLVPTYNKHKEKTKIFNTKEMAVAHVIVFPIGKTNENSHLHLHSR